MSTRDVLFFRPVSGFSLVELMITLALSIFLLGALVLTYLTNLAATRDAEALSRMQENVRIISEYLVRDVRNAGFRDEASLIILHEDHIRNEFAWVSETGDRLRVRYAGRGHCGQAFDEVRVVENEYFLSGTTLTCQGKDIEGSQATTTFNEDAPEVGLVDGIASLRFNPICRNNQVPGVCNFSLLPPTHVNYRNELANAFVGVEMVIGFQGNGVVKEAQLISTFRNVVLERIRRGIPEPVSAS